MKYSETIKRSMTPDDIGQMVSDKNSLKHLVLSCHGFGDPAKGPFLDIGTGFRNEDDFKQLGVWLFPVVEQVIWIGACSICGTSQGNDMCARLAKTSRCFVVAPGITLPPVKVGINRMEVFTRSLPHYFDRDGKLIGQGAFLKKAGELDFKLVEVRNAG